MLWSLTDFFFRSNFFPVYSHFLLNLIIVLFVWMAVQFHVFSSSFFSPMEGRWLPLAYGTLALIIGLVISGHFPEGVESSGDRLYPEYGAGVLFLAVPLFTILARNIFVFRRRLRNLENPGLYNQIVSLLVGLGY